MSDRLNFSDIERNATPQSIERGREYYEWGQVQSIVRRGSLLQASVMGQSEPWYETFLDVERCEGDCSCPYDWGGWCKHIVALALTYLNDSEQIENRFSLDELIERLI
ncbi:SWIM zinc finger family protein [Baaleninema sp.]|uniref:SWIM zinc finger family protein n=1 Tax=Baaleninema sp. TaxID=3101197 RepID=UPI003D02EE9B